MSRDYAPCSYCESHGLCAADCANAPWNHDREPSASRFVYLLRQRRWCKSPVPRRDIFWARCWPVVGAATWSVG